MNLLAIDTSTSLASVALSIDGQLFVEEKKDLKAQSTFILPMIDALFEAAKVDLCALDGIIFGQGPGSFTGLRIACSLAKGLAFAQDIPLYGVSGADAIAHQVPSEPAVHRLVMLDARMQQVYWAFYKPLCYTAEVCVSSASDIQLFGHESVLLVGVDFESYQSALSLDIQKRVLSQRVIYPHASAMISFVDTYHPSPVDVALAEPLYVRHQVTQGELRG